MTGSIRTIVQDQVAVGFVISFRNGYGARVRWGPINQVQFTYEELASKFPSAQEVSSPSVEVAILFNGNVIRTVDDDKPAIIHNLGTDKLAFLLARLSDAPEAFVESLADYMSLHDSITSERQ